MADTQETIDHQTLLHLLEAGAVKGTDVNGQPGGWNLIIRYGMVERTLAARRGSIRLFSKLDTLIKYLKSIGVAQCNLNLSNFDDSVKRVSRPDTVKRFERTKQAVEYDKWFRDQVSEGIREADDPATVWMSNEEVEAMSDDFRKKLVQRIDGVAA
jgi:hypothetical protein